MLPPGLGLGTETLPRLPVVMKPHVTNNEVLVLTKDSPTVVGEKR